MTHQIIKTKDYLVIVEDTTPKKGDYGLGYNKGIKDIIEPDHYIFKHDDSPVARLDAVCVGSKRIITHLPLNNFPVLEGVDLLPAPEQDIPIAFECEMESPSDSFTSWMSTFMGLGTQIKKSTNSEGQTVWLGKYIFQ